MILYPAPGRHSSYLVKFDAAQFFFGFISVTVVSWLDNFESDAVTHTYTAKTDKRYASDLKSRQINRRLAACKTLASRESSLRSRISSRIATSHR